MEGMHTRKGFSKSAERNLLHSQLPGTGCQDILVTEGSVGKQISLLRYSSDFHNLRNYFGVQFLIA